MYGALLANDICLFRMAVALIEVCQLTMIIAWAAKRFLLFKEDPLRHGLAQRFWFCFQRYGLAIDSHWLVDHLDDTV